MGGRAGEEILLSGDFTSGSSQDYAAARWLARQMVTRFGMGAMGVAHAGCDPADEPATEVQAAVNDLLEDSMLAARALVQTSQPLLEAIAAELVDEETLDRGAARECVRAFEPVGAARHERRVAEPVGAHRELRSDHSLSVDE